MKKLPLLVLTLSLSWLLAGCLNSPLLNHADADQVRAQAPAPAQGQQNQNGQGEEAAVPAATCPFVFADQGLCASLEWKTMPADEQKGAFVLRFWDSRSGTEHGPYVNPAYTVGVKLWMPDMGHGSSPVKIAQATDASGAGIPGVYNVTDVYFVMGGHWEIWVQLKQDKQVISQSRIGFDL